jgi:hypothetical protein
MLSIGNVLLADLGHRQPAPVGVERVAPPGELLLLGQQPLAGGQPLIS